jgi:hypothetical protein
VTRPTGPVDDFRPLTKSQYPIVDFPRGEDHVGIYRDFGFIESYVKETDSWVALPVRLTFTQGGGETIELGPYNLGRAELRVLYEAIMAWGQQVHKTNVYNEELDAAKAEKAREDRKVTKLAEWLTKRPTQ